MQKLWQYFRDFWNSLPHTVQGGLIAFASGFAAAAAHELSEPTACFSPSCLRHYVPTFIAAGVVALRAFYLIPSTSAKNGNGNGPLPTPPPAPRA
jgi:hypothetical protein